MKRVLAVILAVFCLELACASLGYSNCGPDKDPVICDLEKSISQQERLLNSLRVKYAKLISRKKQLLEWIEQEKLKLEQKQAGPVQLKAENKPPDSRDINYLNRLIKKQKKLGAAITELEINIAAEEKKLKQLRENRKLLPNFSKL